jgi:hypothetical protein
MTHTVVETERRTREIDERAEAGGILQVALENSQWIQAVNKVELIIDQQRAPVAVFEILEGGVFPERRASFDRNPYWALEVKIQITG